MSLVEALSESGAEVAHASDGANGLAQLERFGPDLVLCDVRMPVMDGLKLLELIRQRRPDVDVVLMTAYDDWQRWRRLCAAARSISW